MTPKEAAERELDDTIRRLAPALDIIAPGDLVATWALVGHAVGQADDDRSRYFHTFSGGFMPIHTAIGLLRLAQVRLEQTEPEDDDTDV